MNKIWCVQMFSDEMGETIVGYATTEEKAKQMIALLKQTDGFKNYEYEYHWARVDSLIINDKQIEF